MRVQPVLADQSKTGLRLFYLRWIISLFPCGLTGMTWRTCIAAQRMYLRSAITTSSTCIMCSMHHKILLTLVWKFLLDIVMETSLKDHPFSFFFLMWNFILLFQQFNLRWCAELPEYPDRLVDLLYYIILGLLHTAAEQSRTAFFGAMERSFHITVPDPWTSCTAPTYELLLHQVTTPSTTLEPGA